MSRTPGRNLSDILVPPWMNDLLLSVSELLPLGLLHPGPALSDGPYIDKDVSLGPDGRCSEPYDIMFLSTTRNPEYRVSFKLTSYMTHKIGRLATFGLWCHLPSLSPFQWYHRHQPLSNLFTSDFIYMTVCDTDSSYHVMRPWSGCERDKDESQERTGG